MVYSRDMKSSLHLHTTMTKSISRGFFLFVGKMQQLTNNQSEEKRRAYLELNIGWMDKFRMVVVINRYNS